MAVGLLTIFHIFEQSFLVPEATTSLRPSSFDWSTVKPEHAVESVKAIPAGKPQKLRRIQHAVTKPHRFDIAVQQQRCKAVKAAAEKAWTSYRERAWMKDELTPVTGGSQDTFGGWGATLIDSLDTLWIMGMKKEFKQAVNAVAELDWSKTSRTSCNVFETTIRYLGGLLAAYDLSKDRVLLAKAEELGHMLYMAFDTPNHFPPFWLDFEKAKSGELVADTRQSAASITSLSLEMTRLTQLTGNNKYYDMIDRISQRLYDSQNMTKLPGLWPVSFEASDGLMIHDNVFSLGAESDSMYEYILKMHAMLGGLDAKYETMYRNASETIIEKLLFRPMTPKKLDILFPGVYRVGDKTPLDARIEHLACFAGGMFAMGGRLFNITEHVNIGARLTHGCMWAYSAFPHGIQPEIFQMLPCENLDGCKWDEEAWLKGIKSDYDGRDDLPKGFLSASDPSYMLRPEAIESIFYMYRITGHEEYREAAWKMFMAIQNATETQYGNAAIQDVTKQGVLQKRDSMDSFWLAETLKYLYLIFSPSDYISLDDHVFNTEAHPFRIPKS